MSEPLIAIATFSPLPGQADTVIDVLQPIITQIQQEQGCLLYALTRDTNDDLYFIEKWASKEDAVRHGTSSPTLALLAEKVSPLIDMDSMRITEMRAIPVGDGKKGEL